jgi:hypothetical protein
MKLWSTESTNDYFGLAEAQTLFNSCKIIVPNALGVITFIFVQIVSAVIMFSDQKIREKC